MEDSEQLVCSTGRNRGSTFEEEVNYLEKPEILNSHAGLPFKSLTFFIFSLDGAGT